MSWKTIYSAENIKKWGLPASSSINNQGYARGLVLTWSEMEKEFRSLTPPPDASDNVWYIVCDVLIIDTNPILNDQLNIFARRIEINSDIAFLIPDTLTSATIVTQEIVRNNHPASLQASFMPADASQDPKDIDLKPIPNRPATIFKLSNPAKVEKDVWTSSKSIVSDFGDNLSNGEVLRLGMVSTFQLATLIAASSDSTLSSNLDALGTSAARLAIDQLAWVAAIADVGEDTRIMSGQARTQLTWLVKQSQGVVLVPPLDFSVYRDAAIARVGVLRSLNHNYDKWVNMDRTNDNWISQAKLTVELQANESELQSQLEGRARSKLEALTEAENEAAKQLTYLEQSLTNANIILGYGVSKWRELHKEKEIAQLILDIVKFGVAVGKIVVMVAAPGAGAAEAGAAGEGAAEGGAGVEAGAAAGEATKVPSQFDQIKELAGPVGKAGGAALAIVRDISKIIKIGKTADALNSMAKDTLKKVDDSLNKTFTVTPLKGLDVVTGGKQVWESLIVTMNDIFSAEEDLLNQIEGGREFIVAFRQLVIGGESYCSARLAVAEASNNLADAKLHTDASKRGVNLAKNTQKDFEANQALYEQLEQEAFGRVLDAKRAVYLELEKYEQAFYYFTLNKIPHAMPGITAPVRDFINESATISGLELILKELNPEPQTLDSLPIEIPVTNYNRFEKTIVVQIDVTDPIFKPYSRIRIDKVDISLKDKSGNTIRVKSVKFGTGGTFRDIMPDGSIAQFSGNPFLRTITYDPTGKNIMLSTVYSRFTDVIFKPTPFSTWSIELPDAAAVNEVANLTFTITGAASPAIDNEANQNFSLEIIETVLSKGLDEAKLTYESRPSEINILEDILNAKGYKLILHEKYDEAIAVSTMNTIANPKSANAFDILGEAYMDKGDITSAIKNYEKSLELSPNNGDAKDMLQKLRN